MRRSLLKLNGRHLPKALRQALVLITLLLLPSAAWGGANSVTHTFDSPVASTDPDYDYTVVSSNVYNWKIKNLKIDNNSYTLYKSESTLGFSVSGANINQTATISFDLISDFGITGTVTRIDIVYNTGSGITGGKFDAGKVGDFIETIFSNEDLPASTENNDLSKEFSVNSNYNCYQFFKNDKIHLTFSFNANLTLTDNVFFNIKAIKIYTNTISVGGLCPNELGAITGASITSYSGKDGEIVAVDYDATNHILTLENAKINGYLYYSEDADLTIKLIGDNAFYTATSNVDNLTLIQSTGTHNLTIIKNTDATNTSLKLFGGFTDPENQPNWDEVQLISGFKSVLHTGLSELASTSGGNLPGYNTSGKMVAYTTLSLKVAGNSPSTNGTISGSGIKGSVSFDVSYNELTLNNATIDGGIEWNGTNDLKLYLSGKNSIISNNGEETPVSVFKSENTCTLFVEKKYNAESATLKYASYGTSDGIVSNASSYLENFIFNVNSEDFNQAPFTIVDEEIKYNYFTLKQNIYPLTVAGIQVHNIKDDLGYKSNILKDEGTPSVTFDETTNTLTLNNAEINVSGNAIETKLASLTIDLQGTNSITTMDGYPLCGIIPEAESGINRAIIFISNLTPAGTLALSSSGNLTNDVTVTSDDYNLESIQWNTDKSAVIAKGELTGLTIAGTLITSEYLDNGVIKNVSGISGTVSFAAANEANNTPATLTLNGAEITGCVEWDKSAPLTIALNGSNKITNENGPAIIGNEDTNTTLTFVKASDAETCKLILIVNDGDITGFSNSESYFASGSGLYYIPEEYSTTITSILLSGGSGSIDNPFIIKTAEDLQDFAKYINNGIFTADQQNVKLNNNIDCKDLEGFNTIGNNYNDAPFKGTFKGEGNTISNLTISSGLGLFGFILGGTVEDLNLFRVSITGNDYATGGIASELKNGGKIENCNLTECTIASKENQENPEVGGIVARMDGSTISYCVVNQSTITATSTSSGQSGPHAYAGGIAASSSGGTISNCYVIDGSKIINSNVEGCPLTTGAIVGYLSNTTMTTLTSNYYSYDVIVETKLGSSVTTREGYDHRGLSESTYPIVDGENVTGVQDPAGAVMYTKDVIIPATAAESIWLGLEHSYYKKTTAEGNTNFSVAPEEVITLLLGDYAVKGTYTLDGETNTVELVNTEYDYYEFTMPDADVTFTAQETAQVSMDEDQTYGSYYNAEKDMAVPMGMTAYIVTGISEDGKKVTVMPVSYIKKGVAVLLEKGKTTEVSETTDFSGSKMGYSDPSNPVTASETSKYYILYGNKFVKVTAGTTIKNVSGGGACYLDLGTSTAAGTRGFYNIGDGENTTGIFEVKSGEVKGEKWDGEWYTLQGRKFTTKPTKPGLYILNGKKVVIK